MATLKNTKELRRIWKGLYEDNDTWRAHWKECAEYILPRRSAFLTNEQEEIGKGEKKDGKIINTKILRARRVMAAGMLTGMTPPTRPWFRLSLPDTDLIEYQPVKAWLEAVQRAMQTIFQRSNFYAAVHNLYRELGVFGFNAMLIEEDWESVIRCRPTTIGEAYITMDAQYRPVALYRMFWMSVAQLQQEFEDSAFSPQMKAAMVANPLSKYIVHHAIYPREQRNEVIGGPQNFQYASIYYLEKEVAEGDYAILRESGYVSRPFVAPRWDVVGTETYGDCPGIETLADVKQLQKMEADKLMALDKVVNPPMNAPTSMKRTGGNLLPGGVNYIDVQQGQQGFTPTLQIRPDLQAMAFELDRIERRIDEHFFVDLFLAVTREDKNMTATEVTERMAERLQQLGPALERLQNELLDPLIDRTFSIMNNMGLIPPAPPEIQGMDYKVEYISVLAQAQRMSGTAAVEQLVSFVGNLAGAVPDVLDKLDADQAVDEYAEMMGTPTGIVRSDDDVEEIRVAREEMQQQQAQQQQALVAAEGAKTMSETPLNKDSALDAVLGGITGAP